MSMPVAVSSDLKTHIIRKSDRYSVEFWKPRTGVERVKGKQGRKRGEKQSRKRADLFTDKYNTAGNPKTPTSDPCTCRECRPPHSIDRFGYPDISYWRRSNARRRRIDRRRNRLLQFCHWDNSRRAVRRPFWCEIAAVIFWLRRMTRMK